MLLASISAYGKYRCAGDSLSVVFWNLENFFDYVDGGTGESDREFSSMGSRHWTKKRFYAKCDAVAKSILWMGDRNGRMPDLIGLAEIENKGVLTKMLRSTALRKYDYEIVHHESGDRRGIDVAILYRRSSMKLESMSVKVPEYEGSRLATRDILHAEMCLADSCRLDFIVNHHPSKYGGEKESMGRREAAMKALKELADSLGNENMIAMGDFNDTPDAASFEIIDGTLMNLGRKLHERGEGTIRYEGKWDLIDMFMVSPGLDGRTDMEICRIPFLMTWERKHPGEKPLRTYSGPRYIGGVSDHCPIILKIYH
ncbi:MAG: hypothetical protein IJ971_11185 [Bacteroidales bacterium]|nr:hypothetical protein [Bacteroidales bacterium]